MPSAQTSASLASSSSEPSCSPVSGTNQNIDDRHDRSSSTPTASAQQAGASAQDKDKPRLTEQEKKNNHIASEQKRRAAIREGFDRLTELVPGLEGQGRSESIVLKKTVDFIQMKLQERNELISEIEPLLSPSEPIDPPPAYDANSTNPPPRSLPRPPPLALPVLNDLRQKRVILASASPRRRQIMSFLGLPNIEVIPSNAAEDFPKTMEPFEYVLATATKKAQTVYEQEIMNEAKGEPGLILAADTVVVDTLSGTILEKPRSEVHHLAMLKSLRDNRDHKVFTAMAAMAPLASARQPGYVLETALEETKVRFDGEVTDELILAYVRTREGADKAGGYGLQGLGSILVESIEGSWDNVVGLPLKSALKLIETVVSKADDDDRLSDTLLDEEEEEE
ncbi:inosine triphosphate pyrophosphatase-like protein [Aspergillus avenaceus]|uniref:Inosine triphosphate pyrophosphatase-like protein n=1 Tax=Aspergillus avenaceus TaxID=36643 RepID=A0A5N6TTH0_ASPAV|nr:inosine triphosphate pyrophosphatase-like protein [Aspergillus avenaceus]